MSKPWTQYVVFILLVVLILIAAAVPIIASDLFRQPYSQLWDVIHRTMARFDYSYNPPGGGSAPKWPFWRTPADAHIYYRDLTLTTADGLELERPRAGLSASWRRLVGAVSTGVTARVGFGAVDRVENGLKTRNDQTAYSLSVSVRHGLGNGFAQEHSR